MTKATATKKLTFAESATINPTLAYIAKLETTPKTETENQLQDLMNKRNKLIEIYTETELTECGEFESVNFEIIQTLSEIATYKTLKFLMANNATNSTATDSNENGTISTYGYSMALKLFNNAYSDIQVLRNSELETVLTDTADIIQESNITLIPFFTAPVVFSLSDTIYTKELKNGNVREYTAFSLACKSIREYIRNQDKRQYKKLHYVVGYTDSGELVTTTKKPKNDIVNIDDIQREKFVSRYNLTIAEKECILYLLDGLTTTETAEKMQVSKRTVERALKSAKEKIAQSDKRVKEV